MSHLVHGQYQINLFDDTEEQVKFYQAMDKLKNKYGERIVSRAVGLQK